MASKNSTHARLAGAFAGAGAVLTVLQAPPAVAQEPAQEPDQLAAPNGSAIEEVIVTARRRREDIQTVPIAITELSGSDLRSKSVETVADLQRFVPSLVALNPTNRDNDQLSIRGLPGVVAYFAEAPIVSAVASAGIGTASGSGPGLYYDLDGVEVLKGPQSTLFGGTTTGGAILFEPKKPGNDFEGYGQVTLGSYDDHELEGAVNLPVIPEKLMIRVAGQMQQRDGFTEDVVHHQGFGQSRLLLRGPNRIIAAALRRLRQLFRLFELLRSHNNGTLGEKLTAVDLRRVLPRSRFRQRRFPGSRRAAGAGAARDGARHGRDQQGVHIPPYRHRRAMVCERRRHGSQHRGLYGIQISVPMGFGRQHASPGRVHRPV